MNNVTELWAFSQVHKITRRSEKWKRVAGSDEEITVFKEDLNNATNNVKQSKMHLVLIAYTYNVHV